MAKSMYADFSMIMRQDAFGSWRNGTRLNGGRDDCNPGQEIEFRASSNNNHSKVARVPAAPPLHPPLNPGQYLAG
jgi:hypothetical protein